MLNRFQSFVTGITTCYKSIQRIKAAEMTELGLKGTHVMCLFFLHHNAEALTAAQLCQLCGEDKAAISRTLVTLQEQGYIETDAKKYRSHIRLTDSGVDIAKAMDHLIEQWVGAGGLGISEQERDTFYHVLDVISSNLYNSTKNS